MERALVRRPPEIVGGRRPEPLDLRAERGERLLLAGEAVEHGALARGLLVREPEGDLGDAAAWYEAASKISGEVTPFQRASTAAEWTASAAAS